MAKKLRIHFYQDIATPHNNELLRELRAAEGVEIVAWYAHRTRADLPWAEPLDSGPTVRFLDSWKSRLSYLATLMNPGRARFVFVGYATPWSRIGLVVHRLFGRTFGYWTDNPAGEPTGFRRVLRSAATALLRTHARPMFVVGAHTRQRFVSIGFQDDEVHNLPICVSAPDKALLDTPATVRTHLGIGGDKVLVVAASRLTREKGFDVLIEAWAMLADATRSSAHLVIAGDGPERDALRSAIADRRMSDSVTLIPWQEPRGYWSLLAAADVFCHPARFDAFGGGTLYAMAFGVPVIGSPGAGVVRERVQHDINGLVVPAEDAAALAAAMERLITDAGLRARFSSAARTTAQAWGPATAARIFLRAMRGGGGNNGRGPTAAQASAEEGRRA